MVYSRVVSVKSHDASSQYAWDANLHRIVRSHRKRMGVNAWPGMPRAFVLVSHISKNLQVVVSMRLIDEHLGTPCTSISDDACVSQGYPRLGLLDPSYRFTSRVTSCQTRSSSYYGRLNRQS